jgi:hypothetical protein
MSSASDSPNPVQEILREAEDELHTLLREACEAEARGVSTESVTEIRQLEDSLLSAAMAARQVRTARRKLRRGERESAPGAAPPASSTDISGSTDSSPDSTEVREFKDETGKRWRAWPVIPNLTRHKAASRRSLGDFQEGWICFEALDNSGRRRLPGRGRRWSDLPAEELPGLLGEAINVPGRKGGSGVS